MANERFRLIGYQEAGGQTENARRSARRAAAIAAGIAVPFVGAAWVFVFVFISLGGIGGSGPEYEWVIYLVAAVIGLVLVAAIAARAYRITLQRTRQPRPAGEAASDDEPNSELR